jgi:predicted GTPase
MILLVMDASSPARAADEKLLRLLVARFARQPEQKPPPLLGVLTHVDRLAPVLEWSPPYDWTDPAVAKENNIRDAVRYNAEQLGPMLRGVVPVCSDEARGREYGVPQWLVPAIVALLDEARASALIRTLYGGLDQNRLSSLFVQLRNAGSVLLQAISFDADEIRHSVDE